MPLIPGSSKKVISENIREFHHGKTFAHTAAKFGKDKANAQAVAVAFSNARRKGAGKRLNRRPMKHGGGQPTPQSNQRY